MHLHRRQLLAWSLAAPWALAARPARASDRSGLARDVLVTWHRLILELVRHTATYAPPVAARAFAYIGVTAHEALASGNPRLQTLAGQLADLQPLSTQAEGEHDKAIVLNQALATAVQALFSNTGPAGQRAMGAMAEKLGTRVADGVTAEVVDRSTMTGTAIAMHILAWAESDGGAVIENLGFPLEYTLGTRPQDWVPTNPARLQQAPLLPDWGKNRPFAMPAVADCALRAPPDYDENPGSDFHQAALEVVKIGRGLTDEQKLIARFWSDDAMLSPTPAGHWISILINITQRDLLPVEVAAAALARLGVAQADAFIACWATKFEFNLLRPVTYIRRHIDPTWEPLLITPPFPEYPSGHSTQSGAASTVLTALFGEDFAFDDETHVDDGLPMRSFASFAAAAEEAAMSRLYGGIHYRFGNERGLEQGRCVGAFAVGLKTET
jgi:PAP2 superfamily